jgi:hypothetical protein
VVSQVVSESIHEELERVMRRYITYHLEQDVKAGTFLHQLKQRG